MEPPPEPVTRRDPLLCRLGFHRWRQISWAPLPSDCFVCRRCGRHDA